MKKTQTILAIIMMVAGWLFMTMFPVKHFALNEALSTIPLPLAFAAVLTWGVVFFLGGIVVDQASDTLSANIRVR